MSNTQKSEALRLADKYEVQGFLGDHSFAKEQWCSQAAVELRRQHARIQELEEQLAAIGAGGVEPLRKPAAVAVPDERAEFEKWAEQNYCNKEDLALGRRTGYRHPELNQIYRGWLARAALAATPAADAKWGEQQ